MCQTTNKLNNKIEVVEYMNYQTGEVLDLERVSKLKDNAMLKVNPHLWCEWDFEKNNELDIWKMTKSSSKKPWWKCKLGHEWEATLNNRNKGKSCPYCLGRYVSVGETDMWTTNPYLASLLANPEDGYRYKEFSNKKVDWKCPDCGIILKNKIITNVNRKGVCCHNCSDGVSYPEKFIMSILNQLNIKYNYNSSTVWSMNKKYDILFSINNYKFDNINVIIEMNGEQHYKECGWRDGKTLKEEIKNDKIKRELAFQNNIDYYIVIDCMKVDYQYIKSNILKSELNKLLDLNKIDWDSCHKNSCSSLIKKACQLWNDGIYSTKEIGKILNVRNVTAQSYLLKGTIINLCDYTPQKARDIAIKESTKRISKKVICLTTNTIYKSLTEASKNVKTSISNIRDSCKNKNRSAGKCVSTGVKLYWMYLSDYEKMLEEQN